MRTRRTRGRTTARLARRAFFVDPRTVKKARKVLGVATDAEAVRLAIERALEMDASWRLLIKTRRSVPPGSFGRA